MTLPDIFIWDINQCTVPVTALSGGISLAPSVAPGTPTLNSSSGFRNNVTPIGTFVGSFLDNSNLLYSTHRM